MNTETAFIGAMLVGVTKEVYADEDKLRINPISTSVEYFDDRYYEMPKRFLESDKLQSIWEAIVHLKKKKQPIDMVTVLTRLRENKRIGEGAGMVQPEFIAEVMVDAGVEDNVGAYYKDIFEKYCLNRIKQASRLKDVHKLLDMAKKYEFTEVNTTDAFERMARMNISNSLVVEVNPYTWTIPCIDSMMGRPVPGLFYVIAGEPGVGKSIIAVDMALGNTGVANIAFLSLEMEKTGFLQNYIHCKIGKKRDDIAGGNYNGEDKAKALQWEEKINSSGVAFIDDTDMSNEGLKMSVEQLIKICDENGVDVAFVDSLSKLRANSEKSHVDEAKVVDELAKWRNRRAAEGKPITIFLIHHLDKGKTNVAGSKKIEEDCDGLVKMRSEDKEKGLVLWETGKLRKNSYCKASLVQKQGGLVEYGFT